MSEGRIIGGTVAAVVAVSGMGAYFEGVFPVGYLDPVGIPTDCLGETQGARVGVQRFSWDECLARYDRRLAAVWDNGLTNCVHRDVTVPQGGALMSWADNIGIAAACNSTLVRLLNAGAPPELWCAQLQRWDKATKLGATITLPGLTRRRAAEYAMRTGDVDAWKRGAR